MAGHFLSTFFVFSGREDGTDPGRCINKPDLYRVLSRRNRPTVGVKSDRTGCTN